MIMDDKVRLIDAELLTTNIAQIAKNCARSDAQKALIGRILFMIENMLMPRYIDAEALKKDLTRFYDNEVTAKELIDEQPTADVQPVKHGRWVKGHCGVNEYIKCSVCRTRIVNTIVSLEGDAAEDYFDLCPKCGARLDGDSE